MKNKIILLLMSLVLINLISAGLNINNGNVGIGITNPGAKLHLSRGDGQTTFSNAVIAFGYSTAGTYPHFIHTRHNTAETNNAIDFYTSDGTEAGVYPTNAVHGMTITNGNVGIGTTSPSATLEVNGPTIIGSGRGATTYNVASFFTSTNSGDYIHIKLPFNPEITSDMFHIKVRGYAYSGSSKIIDLTYVGYAYAGSKSIIATAVLDPIEGFAPYIYQGSDDYVYLRFKPSSTYYLTFTVDSMFVGNGRIIKPGEITIQRSSSAEL